MNLLNSFFFQKKQNNEKKQQQNNQFYGSRIKRDGKNKKNTSNKNFAKQKLSDLSYMSTRVKKWTVEK